MIHAGKTHSNVTQQAWGCHCSMKANRKLPHENGISRNSCSSCEINSTRHEGAQQSSSAELRTLCESTSCHAIHHHKIYGSEKCLFLRCLTNRSVGFLDTEIASVTSNFDASGTL